MKLIDFKFEPVPTLKIPTAKPFRMQIHRQQQSIHQHHVDAIPDANM